MVIDLRVEVALHDIPLVVPIVCACPTAWGVGNMHQAAAVEEEPCPSAVGSISPGAVDLAESIFSRVVGRQPPCSQAGRFGFVVANLIKKLPM